MIDHSEPLINCKNLRSTSNGSVLIIVLWITLTLVSVTIVFAEAMRLEYRAADNQVGCLQADLAIQGACTYIRRILENSTDPGTLPSIEDYDAEAVPVGEALFWLIGRNNQEQKNSDQKFSLKSEAGKININTAPVEILETLPRMTVEFAASIVDWRDEDSEITAGGAEDETYLLRTPKYHCKNAPFETIEELRLVSGSSIEILLGEDTNMNGLLDPNENDGDQTQPNDNQNGRLEPGLLEYVTVFSSESNKQSDGSNRVNITNQEQLQNFLQEKLGSERASQLRRVEDPGSILEFYVKSGLTEDEYAEMAGNLTISNESAIQGLIDFNAASETVLECIPGIGAEFASQIIASRGKEENVTQTLAWLGNILGENNSVLAGPFLTDRSYQIAADIVAMGRNHQGLRRELVIFDTTDGDIKIIFRRKLDAYGYPFLLNEIQDMFPVGLNHGMSL